jgi:hypothetical protein
MLFATLLAACVYHAPTAYGLRGDAILPPQGEWEVVAQDHHFGDYNTMGDDALVVSPLVGAQGTTRFGASRFGVRSNLSALVLAGEEVYVTGEGDVLLAIVEQGPAPLSVSGSGGMSFGRGLLEPQLGLTASRTLAGTLTPYVGARVNPYLSTLDGQNPVVWLQLGGGLSWRPEIGKATAVFGLEGTYCYGYGVIFREDGMGNRAWGDHATWGATATAGLRVGKPSREVASR